jgi:hypothetical protein
MRAMELDPIPQVFSSDPHPVYRAIRERHRVHHVPERALWVLSHHADVLAALRDPETYSSARGIVPSGFVPEKPTLIVMDGAPHTLMRRRFSARSRRAGSRRCRRGSAPSRAGSRRTCPIASATRSSTSPIRCRCS